MVRIGVPTYSCAGWELTDARFLAAAVSPLKLTSPTTSRNAHSRLYRESMLGFIWLGGISSSVPIPMYFVKVTFIILILVHPILLLHLTVVPILHERSASEPLSLISASHRA